MSQEFEQRKKDHVRLALDPSNQAVGFSGLDQIQLMHDSLPEINLADVSIESHIFDETIATPFFISGMTAGHEQAGKINLVLATLCASRGWLMGVGSQRRELEDQTYADASLLDLKSRFPKLKLISNLGIAQLIEAHLSGNISQVIQLAERLGAQVLGIHLNPLQEAIQEEGTPHFEHSQAALAALIKASPIPVLIKETGSGMSEATLNKLKNISPLFAVDVSGLGGTHWGRVEGKRGTDGAIAHKLGETFKTWGISTADSVQNAVRILKNSTPGLGSTEVWASGGVRSGLDAAKLFALGANRVGFAAPALTAALQGEHVLDQWMQLIEKELKIALFCTNSSTLTELNATKIASLGAGGSP